MYSVTKRNKQKWYLPIGNKCLVIDSRFVSYIVYYSFLLQINIKIIWDIYTNVCLHKVAVNMSITTDD